MIMETTLPVLLGRLDFAWITTMHILWPPLTIGLALILFVMEVVWLKTQDERWYRLIQFFSKIFIINFGAGVATGVTMELAFGILYGPFSQAVGPFFGNILGFETITAFMYEAGFIGLMILGWDKVSRGMHLFATFNVMLAASLSAYWIVIANSWQQTPDGVIYKDGLFQVTNWWNAIFNANGLWAFPHMEMAAIELALFTVAGMSAWMILKKKNHAELFSKMLKPVMLALILITPLQIFTGDTLGVDVAHSEPTSLDAMEGHFHTYLPNGKPNTAWNLIAIPNAAGNGNAFSIQIPHVLSLLETHTMNGAVVGMDHFAPRNRPDVWVPFYSFRIMVTIGFFLFFMALWGVTLIMRGKLTAQHLQNRPWFLRSLVFSAFLPYLAVWTGWWTREVGRQPWIVFHQMRTYQGISHLNILQQIFWFAGYVLFELTVWAGAWYFFLKVIRQGPDMNSPLPGTVPVEHQADGGVAHPTFAKPAHKPVP
jgi:cytochrome d ubiquinol oxidase subunit I